MNKIETWKKYELFELFNDLEKAEKLLAQSNGGNSEVFFSAEDFHKSLVEEINEKKHENVPDFRQICLWFAPTSIWNDFIGVDGMQLANQIYIRAYRWDNKNEKDW